MTVLTTPRPVAFADIAVDVNPAEDGGFVARNDELQVVAYGDSKEAALASFRDSVAELVAFCIERRLPLPPSLRTATEV